MSVAVAVCNRDSMVVLSGGNNYGSGQDVHNAVGPEGANTNRVLLLFGTSLPPGITNLVYARLYMHRSSSTTGHDTPTNGAQLTPARITGDWTEGSWNPGSHTYSTTNAVVYPGPATAAALSARGSQPASGWWYIDVSPIVQDWINGSAIKGIQLTATQDVCFDSRHTGFVPYLEISYGTSSAPNAPSSLSPADGTIQGSSTGDKVTVQGTYTHSQSKYGDGWEVALYPSSATDGTPGNPLKDYSFPNLSIPSGTAKVFTFTALAKRTTYKWRMRFSYGGLWGAWNSMRSITTASLAAAPTQPYVTPGTLTPDFFASISTSDPADYITAASVFVYQDTPSGTITKWASDKVSISGLPTRFQLAYGGSALAYDTKYRWKASIWNRDDVQSPFTGNLYFTQNAAVGALISPSDTSTKQNTKTPTFTLTRNGGGNFDQYRMRFYNEAGTTVLYDTGTVAITSAASTPVTPPAGIWDWGMQPKVDAAIRNTGDANIGPFSEQKTIRINAQPGSPYPITAYSSVQATAPALLSPVGVGRYVADTDEYGTAGEVPFRDTDLDLGYAEYPSLRAIYIHSAAPPSAAQSLYVQKMFARHDQVRFANVYPFDQEAALAPTSMGWVAGSTCALSWDSAIFQVGESLKLAFTNLPTATTSTTTLADALRLGSLYTKLDDAIITTFRIYTRKSAAITGLTVKLRFTFSGNSANFAEFDTVPTATNAFEAKVLTKATPAATGGTVNWAQVSGLEIRVAHTAGSNQTFNIYVDELSASAFPAEASRWIRAIYDDTAAVRANLSGDSLQIRRTAGPTLSAVTPAAAAVLTDPTPTFAWTYASVPGKAQASYRLRVYSGALSGSVPVGDLLYDSSTVAGTAASVVLPPFLLNTGLTYSWLLDVADTDGLLATQIARSFTTTFTQPPDVTGVTAVADSDTSSILVQWTASGLAANEFYAYYVEARVADEWVRVATILTQASVKYRYKGAPHNVETQLRVLVDNGWQVSPGATIVTATVTNAGFWRVDDNAVLQIEAPNSHSGEATTLVEEFDPPFGGTIVQTWGTAEYRGRFQVFMPPDNALLPLLREDKATGRTVKLKFYQGDVRYARIKTVPDTLRGAGYTDVDFTYVGVTPVDADYGAVEA